MTAFARHKRMRFSFDVVRVASEHRAGEALARVCELAGELRPQFEVIVVQPV